jgi:hypothetical protein
MADPTGARMMSFSIRVGVPTPDDPEGRRGPGNWWVTGSCMPAYQPGYERRPRRGFRLWKRRRSEEEA